jgi:prophage DNA circulation protein
MAWQDIIKSRPASFRGAAFEVEDTSGAFGRRVQVFEYPQRDQPYAEDMGKRARELTINGFVVGADYMRKRDDLLHAIEAPGAGTLVHPFLGVMQVTVTDCQLAESVEDGGIARFSLAVVETGALSFPIAVIEPSAAVDAAADTLLASLVTDWEGAFNAFSDAADVLASTIDSANKMVSQIEKTLFGPASYALENIGDVQDAVDALAGNVESLLTAPGDLAVAFIDLFQAAGTVGSYEGLLSGEPLSSEGPLIVPFPATPESPTPGQLAAKVNATAFDSLIYRSVLAEYARALVKFSFTSYTEALEARDRLAALLTDEVKDAEADAASAISAATYAALAGLKAAAIEGIAVGAADLAALVEIDTELTTTLTLAYSLYGDATRAEEIEDRNSPAIHSPAFVSGRLRVLEE